MSQVWTFIRRPDCFGMSAASELSHPLWLTFSAPSLECAYQRWRRERFGRHMRMGLLVSTFLYFTISVSFSAWASKHTPGEYTRRIARFELVLTVCIGTLFSIAFASSFSDVVRAHAHAHASANTRRTPLVAVPAGGPSPANLRRHDAARHDGVRRRARHPPRPRCSLLNTRATHPHRHATARLDPSTPAVRLLYSIFHSFLFLFEPSPLLPTLPRPPCIQVHLDCISSVSGRISAASRCISTLAAGVASNILYGVVVLLEISHAPDGY